MSSLVSQHAEAGRAFLTYANNHAKITRMDWTDYADVTLPPDSQLTRAWIAFRRIPPTPEEVKRGQFREDIQTALTSVNMPGGIFGTPREVTVRRSVHAESSTEWALFGVRKVRAYVRAVETFTCLGDSSPVSAFVPVAVPGGKVMYMVPVGGPEILHTGGRHLPDELSVKLAEVEEKIAAEVQRKYGEVPA